MRHSKFTILGGMLLAAGMTLSGCAAPERNAMLEEARAAYATASRDPLIVSNAPVELQKAGESLQQAQNLWQSDAEAEQVTHQSYLARQQTAIAREAAQLKQAQDMIAGAEAQRQQVLLEARSRETEIARQQTETTQKELEEARLQAEEQARQAQQEMQQLQRELSELQARQTPRGIVLTLQDIVFEVDKAELQPGAERAIDKIAGFLQEHPDRTVLVEGFTDSTGPAEYNKELSERRAQAVAEALTARGVDPQRLQTRGYGQDYPIASNQSPSGRQLNRRVEIIISNGTGTVSRKES